MWDDQSFWVVSVAYCPRVLHPICSFSFPSLDVKFGHLICMDRIHTDIYLACCSESSETIFYSQKISQGRKSKSTMYFILEWREWELNDRLFAYIEPQNFRLHYKIHSLKKQNTTPNTKYQTFVYIRTRLKYPATLMNTDGDQRNQMKI